MSRVILFADFFGRTPEWLALFFRSCAANPAVAWIMHTDMKDVGPVPTNVMIVAMSRERYCRLVSEQLAIDFSPSSMYNICNIRPAIGELFGNLITSATHFGWCDVDVVFGDIGSYLTDDVLRRDVISFSGSICSGHLTLLRNTPKYRSMYRSIPEWRKLMSSPKIVSWEESLDESWLSVLCSPKARWRLQYSARSFPYANRIDQYRRNNHFEEQWTTPFTPMRWRDGQALHPEVWYWDEGTLSNCSDGEYSFPYLHLMNFKSPRYVRESLYGHCATWLDARELMHPSALTEEVVRISRLGISGISRRQRDAELEQFRNWRASSATLCALNPAEMIDASTALGVQWTARERYADLAGVLAPEARRRVAAYLTSHRAPPRDLRADKI